jgi:hypothetical protein
VRNISAPTDNEASEGAPRMLRVQVTDGKTKAYALEVESMPQLSLDTPPGTKILLQGPSIPVQSGFIVLGHAAGVKVLGGHVGHLVDNWELQRSLSRNIRFEGKEKEGGRPAFVAFSAAALERARQAKVDRMSQKKEGKKDLYTQQTLDRAAAAEEAADDDEGVTREKLKSEASASMFHDRAVSGAHSARLQDLQTASDDRRKGRDQRGRRGRRGGDLDDAAEDNTRLLRVVTEDEIKTLVGMGFPLLKARAALQKTETIEDAVALLSADPPVTGSDANIKPLTDMGFSQEDAEEALRRTSSIDAAIGWLIERQESEIAPPPPHVQSRPQSSVSHSAVPPQHGDRVGRGGRRDFVPQQQQHQQQQQQHHQQQHQHQHQQQQQQQQQHQHQHQQQHQQQRVARDSTPRSRGVDRAAERLGDMSLGEQPKVGDLCRAVYVADGSLYDAVVRNIDAARGTAMVEFLGYGETQETKLADIQAATGRGLQRHGEGREREDGGADRRGRMRQDVSQPLASRGQQEGSAVRESGLPPWMRGDKCQAVYAADGERYDAVVERVDVSAKKCWLRFVGYEEEALQVTPFAKMVRADAQAHAAAPVDEATANANAKASSRQDGRGGKARSAAARAEGAVPEVLAAAAPPQPASTKRSLMKGDSVLAKFAADGALYDATLVGISARGFTVVYKGFEADGGCLVGFDDVQPLGQEQGASGVDQVAGGKQARPSQPQHQQQPRRPPGRSRKE